MRISSLLLALLAASTKSIAYGFLIVGIGLAISTSSIFIMLPLLTNESAFATFPGENGKIAFTKNADRVSSAQIYIMNPDGSEETRLTNNNANDLEPSMSPNGTKIAFVSDRERGGIFVMNAADGSDVTGLYTFGIRGPSWSPDGEKIAFFGSEINETDGTAIWGIHVMNAADGSIVTRLTTVDNYATADGSPDWSPDGEKIVFVRQTDRFTENFKQEIYVMNADDGSDVTRLTDGIYPSWSPDGEKIAFNRNDGIYVMNADGSGQTRLTVGGDPSWSPDGEKIAFVRYSDIYVMNADGSGQTNISNNPGLYHEPSWGTAVSSPPEEDTTPPTLTVPDDMVVEATSEQVAQVTFTVTAQDDVDGTATLEEDGTTITQDDGVGGDITIACNPASGSEFPLGDSTVHCSARDAAGNFVRASFMVTVNSPPPPRDTTPPVITVPPDITEEATGPNGATVSFEVSAHDDVDGPVDVECDHNSGETFPIGETVVTCTAEDAAGNRGEESFTVTVQDTTSPDVEITKAVDKKGVAIVEGSITKSHYILITFEATDAVGVDKTECSLDVQVFTSCTSPVVYDHLKKGTHNLTVRSTDAAGNIGEDQFTWTVNPAEAAKTKPR